MSSVELLKTHGGAISQALNNAAGKVLGCLDALRKGAHDVGVLPRMAALSKKSSFQQLLQEKAESAWGTCGGDRKKKDLQHYFTN